MADFFQWDPNTLSVKVKAMDDEHQVLIKKMNLLHAAHAAKRGRDEVGRLLGDLAGYTARHFGDEEAYMESVHYEGLKNHKRIHQQLLDQLKQYAAEFTKTGELRDAFFQFLAMWLKSHIRGIDTKYAEQAKVA